MMAIKMNMLWHGPVISCRRSLCWFARNECHTKGRIVAADAPRNATPHHDARRVVSSYATSADRSNTHYDVIISGGGMVGTSLAASLGMTANAV